MKVKVLERFKDRHTNEIHEVNKVLTISKERYEEILAVGRFVEEVKKPKKEAVKEAE